VDPLGGHLVAPTLNGIFTVSLPDGAARALPDTSPGGTWLHAAVSRDGRLAASFRSSPPEGKGIRVWELESSEVRVLEESRGEDVSGLAFAPDGSLFSGDMSGRVDRWDLERGGRQVVTRTGGNSAGVSVSADGRYLVVTSFSVASASVTTGFVSTLTLCDLHDGSCRPITSHGNRVGAVALDATGSLLVTADTDGVVRVGPITGEEPHLLLGHGSDLALVAIHPDGSWIASALFGERTVGLWPMPEGQPLQTLPYEELMGRLRAFTNLRVVPDEVSATGYTAELGPFPGWAEVPEW